MELESSYTYNTGLLTCFGQRFVVVQIHNISWGGKKVDKVMKIDGVQR